MTSRFLTPACFVLPLLFLTSCQQRPKDLGEKREWTFDAVVTSFDAKKQALTVTRTPKRVLTIKVDDKTVITRDGFDSSADEIKEGYEVRCTVVIRTLETKVLRMYVVTDPLGPPFNE